jgi:predicted transcriptional regulator
MARTKDTEKEELVKKLGLEDSKKNWTKKELQDRLARQHEKEQQEAEFRARAQMIAGDVPNVPPEQLPIPYSVHNTEDPLNGLTERQKLVARLRMRGLSQDAIANVVGVSQSAISHELAAIKKWQAERGRNVDQAEVVGNTASLYEEVEYRAWELYHATIEIGEKAKALAVVMQAREKHTKLLMDLGLIKKANQEITHKIEVSPFIQNWQSGEGKRSLGDAIVAKQLTALAEPTFDSGIEDADVVEEDEEASVNKTLGGPSDLAEPTPDDSEDFVLDDE